MNEKLRKKLLKLDKKIYFLRWKKTRLISEEKLKTETNQKKRYKLMADWIFEPFFSKYLLPFPSVINSICRIVK